MNPDSKKTPEHSLSNNRKRLLPDHPNPAVAPLRLKKTRDLPNVMECCACNRRTDMANGTNPMRILYSEWRIILLCKKCYSRVKSRQVCSYCFKKASSDCFSCRNCRRVVHKTCFSDYKSVPPWSYSSSGNEFSVCIDCWLPVHIAGTRGNIIRKDRDARILDHGIGTKSLDHAVKIKNFTVLAEEKVELAARARQMATEKAETARHALETANSTLGEMAKKNVFDVTELALQLQQAISSSPRISKDENLEPIVFSSVQRVKKPICQVYMRRPRYPNCRQSSDGTLQLEEGESSCQKMINSLLDQKGKVKPTRLFYSRTRKCGGCQQNSSAQVQMEACTETIASGGENNVNPLSKGKQDHYLLKYRRKKSRSKEINVLKSNLLDACSSLEHRSPVSQILEPARISIASPSSFSL